MTSADGPRPRRRPWGFLLVALLGGLAMFAVDGSRGHWEDGIDNLVVMAVFGAVVLVFASRSEIVALVGGADDDERRAHIQRRAAATTGSVMTVVVSGGFLWTLDTGSAAATVFGTLSGIAGATLLLSTAWYARRG